MNLWTNLDGGGLIATGVEGAFTGMGAMLGVVDDSLASREAAESLGQRDKTWDWLLDVFIRGLETTVRDGQLVLPSMIVVQTRWHVDDVTGRLLAGKCDRFKTWEHIHLRPIIQSEDGTERSLWPEKWPLDELKAMRGNGSSRTWTSLYEGDPLPDGGALFGPSTYETFPGDEGRVFGGLRMAG
jgi:hypothetical protein